MSDESDKVNGCRLLVGYSVLCTAATVWFLGLLWLTIVVARSAWKWGG